MKKLISLILSLAMVLCAFGAFSVAAESGDPADSYVHTDAEFEDASLRLWFDYASRKITPDTVDDTGMETFSVYMAKNEIEGAQLVLYSESDRAGYTAALSGFVNEAGDTLEADVFIQLYHDCDSYGMVPDAIPPLSAHGPFDLSAGKTQAFLVKITTEADSAAGWYSSDLSILDGEGREVKKTKIFVNVWDFALSEETACDTSIGLAMGYLSNSCASDGLDAQTRYKNYYDYLLENRVCAMYLPYELHEAGVTEYLDNPRVTSFQLQSDKGGTKIDYAQRARLLMQLFGKEEYAHRFEKAYYFAGALNAYKNVLDPLRPDQLETLKSAYDTEMAPFSKVQPSYSSIPVSFLSTYFADIDYTLEDGTVIDQIDYYDDFVSLLCSKPFAYTENWELATPGAKVMQPDKWTAVYGSFKDRMAEYKAKDGNKLWWFISWDVEAPYINYYMQTEGVSQRLLFWQQYDCGVEGFLYNFANFWIGDCADPYSNNITDGSYPNAHGESILIYPGATYGLTTPVGSLRLEAMRDGIEDYQLFTMLDSYKAGASAALIHKMTTGVCTYSADDGEYYETRKALGAAVEAAEKGECIHSYEVTSSVPAGCTEGGVDVYVCALCGDSYSEATESLGHEYADGACVRCGAADPDATPPEAEVIRGDLNGDGKVNSIDTNVMKRLMSGASTGSDEQNKAADVNGDGKVNSYDTNRLKRYIAGQIDEL